jgi:hypothetical protein
VNDSKAVPRDRTFRDGGSSASRPDEEIDEVFVTPLDERCDGPVFETVEPAGHQIKELRHPFAQVVEHLKTIPGAPPQGHSEVLPTAA